MQMFTGKEYLMIDIANSFGLDKLNWQDRINWFKENENQLEKLTPEADDDCLYQAGVMAWRKVQKGLPSGYPVSLDATCSGMQILACLCGDIDAAKLCNVVPTGKREDAYKAIYEFMLTKINEDGKIKREDTKKAIMTSLYGSSAVPKQVFGEGNLYNIFLDTMKECAGGTWEINEAFLDMWQPNNLSHDWILPDNFHVHIKVIDTITEVIHFLNEPFDITKKVNKPMESGRSLGANATHSIDGFIVREIVRRCSFNPQQIKEVKDAILSEQKDFSEYRPKDKMLKKLISNYKKTRILSARIFDYIDIFNNGWVDNIPVMELIDSLPTKPFNVITIHDCFRVLPNYGNDIRKQYTRLLYEIAKSNLLNDIISQIIGRRVDVGKVDPNMYKLILDSDYALS